LREEPRAAHLHDVDDQTVEILGFTFRASVRGGIRFVEAVWPEIIPFASLSIVAWRLLELWDEEPDVPTVMISDLGRVSALSDTDVTNLATFTAGVAAKPNAFLAAWFAENNTAIEIALRRMLVSVTGTDRAVFHTRDEAYAAIDRAIERRMPRGEA
jgi:hypothetical protein